MRKASFIASPPPTRAAVPTASPHRVARAAGELAELMSGRPPAQPPTEEAVIPFEQQLAALRVPPRQS